MDIGAVFRKLAGGDCCQSGGPEAAGLPKVLIVGNPNVGKSLLFNRLTGSYVTVSNYPGTTVDISRGRLVSSVAEYSVIDTPGMYSLAPITDEERVTYEILMHQKAHAVVHVIDAKNIGRMLGLTLQLAEAGLPLILVLNMADEARALGIRIQVQQLQERLGFPVLETVATTGQGVAELAHLIAHVQPVRTLEITYGPVLEEAIAQVAGRLDPVGLMSPRARALLILQDDAEALRHLREGAAEVATAVQLAAGQLRGKLEHSVSYHATLAIRAQVDKLLAETVVFPPDRNRSFAEGLSRLLMRPLFGVPMLFLVLYFGLYKFVGGFGAGFLVDFIQNTLFGNYVLPWVEYGVKAVLPWPVAQELFIGDYGIFTLGIRYAVAIIFPIVGTFFIAFSILEDSGYLPRLAMLIDRVFKQIGLNGRAVIPIVLGFGCDTMATMVTRTLETRRERTIAMLLLALAIPCSAQLGVILGLLAAHPYGLVVWMGIMVAVFLVAGLLAARLMPGEGPSFYMELPPLRLPRLGNVLVKTYTRMEWYFREVFPLFILASVLIWLGRVTGLFQVLIKVLVPVVNALGLPDQAAKAFLFGFFRRDYGVAGLYDLHAGNALTGNQLTVAAVTLTLFLPCIAQLLIMKKEGGTKSALVMGVGITVVAFVVGFGVNGLFNLLGWQL